jgi:transposase
MALPKWLDSYRKPKTEIRFINNRYYLYEVSYKYSTELKRTRKITGPLLGRISKEEGFIPSSKAQLRKTIPGRIHIAEYGPYRLFLALMEKEVGYLAQVFEDWKDIVAVAMIRWIYQSPIKNMEFHWNHSYNQVEWKNKLSDKTVSTLLRAIGSDRQSVLEYFSYFRHPGEYLLIDSTDVFSKSEHLGINSYGYNSNMRYETQVNLLFIFSQTIQLPVYYRILPGNIRDVKAFKNSLQESGIEKAIIITDKGFYSEKNRQQLTENQLQYIMPLKRNNPLLNYSAFEKGDKVHLDGHFEFERRIIWYWEAITPKGRIIIYLDSSLKLEEEKDYLRRMVSHPEKYDQQGFMLKQYVFGTIGINTNLEDSAETIYQTYKSRGQIEQAFDTYKNFLHADRTYMQNEKALDGWFFINFLAMQAYYKLYKKLKDQKLLKKYSPNDIIQFAKTIRKCKIKDQWIDSEATAKTISLYEKLII